MNNNSICYQCGVAANTLTTLLEYGELPLSAMFEVSTWHLGVCDICKREVECTEARDFYHPDFSLLSNKFKKKLKELYVKKH